MALTANGVGGDSFSTIAAFYDVDPRLNT